MPIGWFIAPYKRDLTDSGPSRYCSMQDADAVVRLDDGEWSETEILHSGRIGKAIVKVRASTATLADLATVYRRLPKTALDDPLSDLTLIQRNAIRGELEDMGYTLAEIQVRFGNRIQDFTLGDVLRFAASRRQKPRWTGIDIVCDGIIQPCRAVDDVHQRCFSDADWTRLKGLRDALMAEWDANQQVIRIVVHPLTASLSKYERDAILILCGRAGYAFDKIRPDTFPTTGVLDTFDQADGPLSSNWTAPVRGTDVLPRTLSNEIAQNASGASSAYWNPTTHADSEAHITLPTKTADANNFVLCLRIANPGVSVDMYTLTLKPQAAATDNWTLRRYDNNTSTILGPTMTQEFTSGDSLGNEMIGSSLSGYYKTGGSWSLLGTRTDATYASGNIGLTIADTTTRGDDFGGGTVITGRTSKNIRAHNQHYTFRQSEGVGRHIGGAKLFQTGDDQNEIATLGKERKFWLIPKYAGVSSLRRESRS